MVGRANRRVEIEISWLEVQERQFEVAEVAAAPTMGSSQQSRQLTQNVASFAYQTGESALDAELVAKVKRLVEEAGQRGEKLVRVQVTGHTDNQPLGPSAGRNMATTRVVVARAKNAAALLRAQLQLPDELIVAQGLGASAPIAGQRTGRRTSAKPSSGSVVDHRSRRYLERRWLKPIQQSATQYLTQGGAIWATEQPLVVTPKMDVLASVDQWSVGARVPTFQAYANYATFVDRFELLIFAGSEFGSRAPPCQRSGRPDPRTNQPSA